MNFLIFGSRRHFSCLFLVLILTSFCKAEEAANLVLDASFESPVASWFSDEIHNSYAEKEKVDQAIQGKFVLAIQGWEKEGSKVLSPPFSLTTDTYSAALQLRSFGTVEAAQVELALFDEKGAKKLVSFGTLSIDGKGVWTKLEGLGVKLAAAQTRGRLGVIVSGPQKGARVEVDQVGLFAGNKTGPVVDNADFTTVEAEEIADNVTWKVGDLIKEHQETLYQDFPSGLKWLSGGQSLSQADNKPLIKSIKVTQPGAHRFWMRVVINAPTNGGKYTIGLQQNNKEVASKEIDDGDAKLGQPWTWIWVVMDANLVVGEAQIVLTRPETSSSWSARSIDLFVLTNLIDYQPKMQDFRPKKWMRFTNLSDLEEPFCLWLNVRRHQGPLYLANPGILSAAGLSGSYYAPTDKTKWLAKGDSSPWVNISDHLLPALGRNNVQIIATRQMHTQGFVTGKVQGKLEFATGNDHHIVKTVKVDQEAPRLLMTLPYDFKNQSEEIRTALDYIKLGEVVLDKIGTPKGRMAQHLHLSALVDIDAQKDDPQVVDREVGILKRLGWNGTYVPLANPKEAAAFNTRHGLPQYFGMLMGNVFPSIACKNGCYYQPDNEKLDAEFKAQAARFESIIDKVERVKLGDESGGPPYAHFISCDFCKKKFMEDLKTRGLSPKDLGVATWKEVVPILPEDKEKHPELFYHTGLFRLNAFAELAKAIVREKQKFLPANVKTYVNYAPPVGGGVPWDERGTDLFLTHRNGGFEMPWTEDWITWGASAQEMSPIYAIMRAAGNTDNQPLGAYQVSVDSSGPVVQRLKYYELLAGGVRRINMWNYGPYYNSVDAWSNKYEFYPVISAVQHEFGVIDEAFHDTKRHKSDIAILYNRTGGIWAHNKAAAEQDSYFIHWALAHAGYDADFIPEEDIESGKLAGYKLLYINGIQIRSAAAVKIADWVQSGGNLVGTAGAGTRNEYNKTLDIFDKVYGARSQNLRLENDVGIIKFAFRNLPVLDLLTTVKGSEMPSVSFNQLCFVETLAPLPGATVVLKNEKGMPAGVINHFGKGIAVRVAALPGVTYLNDAVRDKNYDAESFLPKKYRRELCDFITWPAKKAKAFHVAEANAPITEIVRYDGQDRTVIFVINHNVTPVKEFVMKLSDAGQFTKAYSATQVPVQVKPGVTKGELEVSFPLDVTDAIVLQK